MSIQLTKEEIQNIIPSVQRYIDEEFDLEIGELKARMLLEYIQTEIAPFAYNNGVRDAEQYFREKVEDMTGSCFEPPLTHWVKPNRSRK